MPSKIKTRALVYVTVVCIIEFNSTRWSRYIENKVDSSVMYGIQKE
jgi:hypothetical protein